MVLQTNRRLIHRRRSQGDNTGQVIPTTEEVELDASKQGQKRERINQGKRPRNRCAGQSSIKSNHTCTDVQVILTSFHNCVLFRFARCVSPSILDSPI